MKKIIWTIVAAVLLFGGLQAWGWYRDNRMPGFTGEAVVYVKNGTTVDDVVDQIKAQTGIRFEKSMRRVFERKRVSQYLSKGHYVITPSLTYVYVARMLNNSWQTPVKLTLSGSLRLKSEIAGKIGKQMQVDSAEVMAALKDNAFLRKYCKGATAENVFSYIIPDTYEMWWDASMEQIFERFGKEHDAFWTAERKAKAKSLGLDEQQVSILASIVNCESNHVQEYPQIAGVYLTRLRKGMKLQADPTVAYCYDFKLGRILNSNLKVDSPYNTYKYAGLPPGPICCPTAAALDGVLNADVKSGYLFFCASPAFDGTHRFSRSYKEHLANARAFQGELNSRKSKSNG